MYNLYRLISLLLVLQLNFYTVSMQHNLYLTEQKEWLFDKSYEDFCKDNSDSNSLCSPFFVDYLLETSNSDLSYNNSWNEYVDHSSESPNGGEWGFISTPLSFDPLSLSNAEEKNSAFEDRTDQRSLTDSLCDTFLNQESLTESVPEVVVSDNKLEIKLTDEEFVKNNIRFLNAEELLTVIDNSPSLLEAPATRQAIKNIKKALDSNAAQTGSKSNSKLSETTEAIESRYRQNLVDYIDDYSSLDARILLEDVPENMLYNPVIQDKFAELFKKERYNSHVFSDERIKDMPATQQRAEEVVKFKQALELDFDKEPFYVSRTKSRTHAELNHMLRDTFNLQYNLDPEQIGLIKEYAQTAKALINQGETEKAQRVIDCLSKPTLEQFLSEFTHADIKDKGKFLSVVEANPSVLKSPLVKDKFLDEGNGLLPQFAKLAPAQIFINEVDARLDLLAHKEVKDRLITLQKQFALNPQLNEARYKVGYLLNYSKLQATLTPEVERCSQQLGINLPQLTKDYKYAFQWQAQATLNNTIKDIAQHNLSQDAAELIKTISINNARVYNSQEQIQAQKEIIETLNGAVSKVVQSAQVSEPEQTSSVCNTIKYLGNLAFYFNSTDNSKARIEIQQILNGIADASIDSFKALIPESANDVRDKLMILPMAVGVVAAEVLWAPLAIVSGAYVVGSTAYNMYKDVNALKQDFTELIQAYNKGEPYTLGKTLVKTAADSLNLAVTGKMLYSGYKQAQAQKVEEPFFNAFVEGAKNKKLLETPEAKVKLKEYNIAVEKLKAQFGKQKVEQAIALQKIDSVSIVKRSDVITTLEKTVKDLKSTNSQNAAQLLTNSNSIVEESKWSNWWNKNNRCLNNKEARELAKELGFTEDKNPPFNTHRGLAFTDGKIFITPDKDGHKGGVWKVMERSGDRLYTCDALLKNILGK
ncbi:hypothetical protein H0X48_05735 [Candidatus Dependentiae bacterium]|nr:hypothetical protein [Candidatus Dependentiae bacterium]